MGRKIGGARSAWLPGEDCVGDLGCANDRIVDAHGQRQVDPESDGVDINICVSDEIVSAQHLDGLVRHVVGGKNDVSNAVA